MSFYLTLGVCCTEFPITFILDRSHIFENILDIDPEVYKVIHVYLVDNHTHQ